MVCVDPMDIPVVAFVDPEMMSACQYAKGLTAATGMDALTHAIEGYITAGAWELSDEVPLKGTGDYFRSLLQCSSKYTRGKSRHGSWTVHVAGMDSLM